MNNSEDGLVRVELHVHTWASKDSLMKPEALLARCERLDIDRLAITDHNVIDIALELHALHPEKIIVGEEIQTTQGELLGYFMSDWVPPGLEPIEAIDRLRAQGAAISVAHPFDKLRRPQWTEDQLLFIAPRIDAIETFNARCLSPASNAAAASFAQRQGLLETVGSDAHSQYELGRATLKMPNFTDAESFKAALKASKHWTRLSPPFVHLLSRYAAIKKRLNPGCCS